MTSSANEVIKVFTCQDAGRRRSSAICSKYLTNRPILPGDRVAFLIGQESTDIAMEGGHGLPPIASLRPVLRLEPMPLLVLAAVCLVISQSNKYAGEHQHVLGIDGKSRMKNEE